MREIRLRDIPFFLHDDEYLSNAIVSKKDFLESDILDYMRDNHRSHNTILDIGANIGNHSVYFANFLNYGSIMAFEPDGFNYGYLAINMAPYKNIGLAKMAVSDHTGIVKFQRDFGEDAVACMSIDKTGLTAVTLMKIDAEWHEPEILDGATDTIIRCRPLILIEDVNVEHHRILAPLGYKIERAWVEQSTYLWKWSE